MTVQAAAVSASFGDILQLRAEERADATAFVFRGDAGELRLTYGALSEQARALAAEIHAAGASGEPVLLMYPPGLDFVTAVFACFHAGAVAVPAYPFDPARLGRTVPRLLATLRDARPKLVLTTAAIRVALEEMLSSEADLPTPRYLATDLRPIDADSSWRMPRISRDQLALLQYTSGSTAAPRGVMLTHDNLLRNSEFICRAFGNSTSSRGVTWLPPYHDMGLIGGVLQPVYAGFSCVLMSPLTFLRRPLSWLRAVSEHRATVSGGPDFAFQLCVRRIAPEPRAELDLSSWEVAFDGSEVVRRETIDAFYAYFRDCGFRREAFHPCYGLAEGTLMVTGGSKLRPPASVELDSPALVRAGRAVLTGDGQHAKSVVGCGRPDAGARVVIADPAYGTRLPQGRVGEIWVSGPSVAAGYWRRPAETEATFGATLADVEGPFLRTGDLGFVLDSELFVTGRIKELMIVGGRNYHPVDVERACEEAVPELRRGCGAAFAFEQDGHERIGIVYEVAAERSGDHDATIRMIRRVLARVLDAQVDAVALIKPRSIPKTTSGKVQRGLCHSLLVGGELEVVAQWSRDR